jgi:signal transduction histidine kinase
VEELIGFFTDNTCLVFFVNGLAFFTLGLATALELRRASDFPLSQGLWLLSSYGFAASLGNWVQMFVIAQSRATPSGTAASGHPLKLVLFVLAALLLLQFGVRSIVAYSPRLRWLQVGFWVLAAVYVGILIAVQAKAGTSKGDWISPAEVWARYLLYFPGLALAGIAFLLQRREWSKIGLDLIARDCTGAAWAFGLKMIVSGLAAIPILGPSEPQISAWVLLLQTARTITTAGIAYFVVGMLRASEMQRRQALDQAVAQRFEAQESALHSQEQVCEEIQLWCTSMADMVYTVSSAISQPISLEETMRIALRETISLAGLEDGAVFLLDEERPVLRLVAHHGLPEWVTRHLVEVKVGAGLAGWVAQEGELLLIDNIAHDPRPFVPRSTEAVRFYAGVPLKARGKVVGVMSVSSPEQRELSRQQLALLVAVGQQLGVAIENSRLYQRVRSLATTEERSRLAREIHDNLSQLLGYLNLKAAGAEQSLAKGQVEEARETLVEVKQIAQDAYADARETIFSLRTTASSAGLLPALKEYLADYWRYYGLCVELSIDDDSLAAFPPDIGIQVSCIIQEALANVRKHAGATRAWLRFEPRGSGVQITIRDNGQGFDPEQTTTVGGLHFGLSIMRERAESVGGRLEVDSRPGEGVQVVIWLPRSQGG